MLRFPPIAYSDGYWLHDTCFLLIVIAQIQREVMEKSLKGNFLTLKRKKIRSKRQR